MWRPSHPRYTYTPRAGSCFSTPESLLHPRRSHPLLQLKKKQRELGLPRREGVYGSVARGVETFLASEERSARVLLSQLAKQQDPWDLVRADTASLLRLGSQPRLVGVLVFSAP